MITRIKEAKSLSSSSAFIIIIVLIVVSVAAIVVGGGDGFSRKYAGIDLREFSGKMLLAQTGVVGKILRFEEEGDGYSLDLLPIELDESLLEEGEKYATSVVPPREGDTPFSYRPEEGLRVTQGYPILRDYAEENNLRAIEITQGNGLPNIPGMETCNVGGSTGKFHVFYEDVAYDTNVGFDDPNLGTARQGEICEALNEFEEILLLDDLGLQPGIVVQASTEKTPDNTLSVVSPQYVGGSGFVSTLLADYLRSGQKRSETSFTDTVSVLGVNSGFMRFNFDESVDWSVDTAEATDYDLATVTRQNMLRLLGFGSFLGHEQENILSSSWERWTEWDRLLFDNEYSPLIDSNNSFNYGESFDYDNFEPGNADNYDSKLLASGGGVNLTGSNLPDVTSVSIFEQNTYPIFTSPTFQKGQSVSGLANEDALSYPIIGKGQVKSVTEPEKQILCMLGLGVADVDGCEDGPRAVAQDVYIERQNNKTVCVNIGRGMYSSIAEEFVIDGEIVETTGGVDIYDPNQFAMYSTPCNGPDFETAEDLAQFKQQHQTQNPEQARSFSWTPSQSDSLYRQYVQFAFSAKDETTGRRTDEQTISIHKCVVTSTGNQLCNGDFQFSGATSSIDYKLPSLQDLSVEGQNIVTCQSSTMPGWCAQGVQDGFSSEFGYTWHPYLIQNPEAFDSDIEDSPRRYAGGSSGAIVQRLRLPLKSNTSYLVTGKVYVTQNGLQPTFWYGSQDTVLKQSDGTYHVDYPEALADEDSVISEYVLQEALTTGEWHSFSWSLNTGSDEVTHIAFGGSNNNGFILYDDLSVQAIGSCGTCLSDIDGDCVTNIDDFMALMDTYAGECPGDTVGCEGDLTFDGVVDTADVLEFISQYGSSCLIEEPEDTPTNACTDGIDNDGDGEIDTADRDECPLDQNCVMAGTCEQGPLCSDRIDNDGDGATDMRDPDCASSGDGKSSGRGPSPSAKSSSEEDSGIIFLDEDGLLTDLSVRAVLLEGGEVVPNSQGFVANYLVTVTNQGKSVEDVNVVGVLPSMFTYNQHVATEKDVAYERNSNTIIIPDINRGDTISIYFNVDITANVCAQLQDGVSTNAYTLLVQLDLCDSFQEVVEQKYGIIQRDPATGILKPARSVGITTGGSRECADGIDNDKDGFTDYPDDPDCGDKTWYSETSSGLPQCGDKIDNDRDGLADFPNDPDCDDPLDTSESASSGKAECSDGIDNDGDGLKDTDDRDCTDASDPSEGAVGKSTQCDDGIDNDGDGMKDLQDRQCTDSSDDDESR